MKQTKKARERLAKEALTTAYSNRALAPIIRYCAEHRGTMTAIKQAFDRKTGMDWDRINFQRWLHPNPQRRKPPLFGTGLLILEVGEKVIEKLEADAWAKAAK